MNQYGVVCELYHGQVPRLTTYFRARESDSGRLEQYYARYQPDRSDRSPADFPSGHTRDSVPTSNSADDLFLDRFPSGFAAQIVRHAESEHGLSVADSTTNENFLGTLLEIGGSPNQGSSADERQRARELLADGERLHFATESYETALGLISSLLTAQADLTAAITEDTSTLDGGMSAYDCVVEPGGEEGLESLGDTKGKMIPPEPTRNEGTGLGNDILSSAQGETSDGHADIARIAPYLAGALVVGVAIGILIGMALASGLDSGNLIALPDMPHILDISQLPSFISENGTEASGTPAPTSHPNTTAGTTTNKSTL
ncbi:hypothetical protein [Candidatus Halobonum tyrrellensis]|uniref:hypothetical protein n=1 Tax=Candidatus Halobonum tyrrellensis TaxID=1431545 RepID=UPI001268C744|nr:hypothetical protein [Candidatus Halobonum tyrrellensis]